MHLKVGIVVVIIAAAVGAAAGRATAPHPASPPRAPARNVRVARSAAASLAPKVNPAGAVAKPGVYALPTAARAEDALRAAGGPTAAADLVAINLAARVEDGEEIAVPLKGVEAIVTDGRPSQTKRARRHAGKRGHRRNRHRQSDGAAGAAEAPPATDAPVDMVDVNAADEATLETLPGVGLSLAQRIIAFRDLNGPFASTDELLDVGGMTSGKVDALSPYVTFR
jgi:competence protein ComEA